MVYVKIDKQGRVELPKALRETAGWGDAEELVIEQRAGILLVQPLQSQAGFEAEQGALTETSARAAATVLEVEDFSSWPGYKG